MDALEDWLISVVQVTLFRPLEPAVGIFLSLELVKNALLQSSVLVERPHLHYLGSEIFDFADRSLS